jgi:hypothetical protein
MASSRLGILERTKMVELDPVVTGAYLSADNIVNGDVLKVLTEGETIEGNWGPRLVLKVHHPKSVTAEKEYNWTMNKTTQKKCMEAWGNNTKTWVGKHILLEKVQQNIAGSLKWVIYGHPVEGADKPTQSVLDTTPPPEPKPAFDAASALAKLRGQ